MNVDPNANPTGSAQGSTGSAGASSDDSSQSSSNNDSSQPKVVPWEVHNRLLGDVAKTRDKNRELEARLGEIESKTLLEKNDFKSLYESEKQKREAAEKKAEEVSGWAISTQRFNAVKEEALKLGLRREALSDLDMVDMEDVNVEVTNTGRFIVKGAKEKAEKIKATKTHWFTGNPPPPINTGGGGTGAGDVAPNTRLTTADVMKAERDWKQRRITEQAYKKIYLQYCKENPAYATPGDPPSRMPGQGTGN